MKTPEELNALKEEVETLNKKLTKLTEEELKQVPGGETSPNRLNIRKCTKCGYKFETSSEGVGLAVYCPKCGGAPCIPEKYL